MLIDGVKVTADFKADKDELRKYLTIARAHACALTSVEVKLCDDGYVDVKWVARNTPFERIRRITGYLVGTTDRWNDSKRAEERDRIKHA